MNWPFSHKYHTFMSQKCTFDFKKVAIFMIKQNEKQKIPNCRNSYKNLIKKSWKCKINIILFNKYKTLKKKDKI